MSSNGSWASFSVNSIEVGALDWHGRRASATHMQHEPAVCVHFMCRSKHAVHVAIEIVAKCLARIDRDAWVPIVEEHSRKEGRG